MGRILAEVQAAKPTSIGHSFHMRWSSECPWKAKWVTNAHEIDGNSLSRSNHGTFQHKQMYGICLCWINTYFCGTKHEHHSNKASRNTEQSRISSGSTWRGTGVDRESGRVGPHWLTASMVFFLSNHPCANDISAFWANMFEHLSINNFYPCGGQHLTAKLTT